jgi:hypothetical protein
MYLPSLGLALSLATYAAAGPVPAPITPAICRLYRAVVVSVSTQFAVPSMATPCVVCRRK